MVFIYSVYGMVTCRALPSPPLRHVPPMTPLRFVVGRFRNDNAKIAEFIEQKSTPERTNSLTLEQKVVLAEHATIWQDRTVRFAQGTVHASFSLFTPTCNDTFHSILLLTQHKGHPIFIFYLPHSILHPIPLHLPSVIRMAPVVDLPPPSPPLPLPPPAPPSLPLLGDDLPFPQSPTTRRS